MGRRLFVGNLAFATTEESLQSHFAQAGAVASCKIVTDRDTGRSRGFAFIEMSTDEEAAAAVTKFNGTELDGRALTVNEARPQENRGGGERRGGFGGGGRGGYGGGGGGRGGYGGGGGGGRGGYGGDRPRW